MIQAKNITILSCFLFGLDKLRPDFPVVKTTLVQYGPMMFNGIHDTTADDFPIEHGHVPYLQVSNCNLSPHQFSDQPCFPI